jgi:hypothetical protein
MADAQQKMDRSALQSLIYSWLEERLDGEALEWLTATSKKLQDEAEDWEFFASFSGVPPKTGKEALELSQEEIEAAQNIRSGWQPEHWSLDELGRTYLVLSIAEKESSYFLDMLEKTFVTADTGESVALYQSLPILPYPEQLDKRAAEGIRSNITSVFNAVAHRNPYPADFMDQGAWNQVVLKALFVESALYLIEGIDRRANEKLAHMLVDYAHERWAADRSVSPELWRAVGPFAGGDMIDDLKKVLTHDDEIQQQAAVLALSASSSSEAKALLDQHPEIVKRAKEKNANWDDIGVQFNDDA